MAPDGRRLLTLAAWALLLGGPGAASAAPAIDTAQASGVAGYPIGIFGSGFGAGAGRVTILGVEATIIRWSDAVIEASVPRVADGTGDLVVVTSGGTARRAFVVYSIDPRFLPGPTLLENLIYQKRVAITGTYSQWGQGAATDFLTYNNGGGAADLQVPSGVAVDLGQAVEGPLWWSFYGSGNWYEYPEDNPRSYAIEGSADSTTGLNGTWATLLTITGNDRAARTHRVELSRHRWLRMRVTETTGGRTFRLREVRAFRPRAGDLARLDSLAVFGDSITATDLEGTGRNAFYQFLRDLKADGTQTITHVMGMVGQNTSVLTRGATSSDPYRSLARAMALQPEVRYWGIALGTNDTNNAGLFASYRDNLVQGIDQLLAAGKVPVLARIPDTAPGGFGTPQLKKEALSIIDELAARYRLIPGPDFYTPFRQNLSTYISDGTHHTAEGARVTNRLWAETLIRSGIYGAGGRPSPFGAFDTPTDNASGVAGSTAVTGWALDDTQVTKVEIYRSPLTGEPTAPNGKIYIGDATFVAGARPDVAALYPTYPNANRAGWGYMLLTNMLPRQGNGSFTLYAHAQDDGGGSTVLGSKTITCSNASATKPFGTLDTPAQGATVSGSAYAVFGWVLTPQPAVVPVTGSTLLVYVDSSPVGVPTYNLYRSDIAQLFPGYANSGGAVFNYILNTTSLANGTHSIAVSATDNQGRTDGIGSRYFSVQN